MPGVVGKPEKGFLITKFILEPTHWFYVFCILISLRRF